MAQRGQRQAGATRTAPRAQRRARDEEGLFPVLAKAVREVEGAAQRGRLRPSSRTKFQVIALLVREERTRVKADSSLTEGQRAEALKRLDGIATILAKTAARDTSLLSLLAEDAKVAVRSASPSRTSPAPASTTSSLCSSTASHASGFAPWPRWRER